MEDKALRHVLDGVVAMVVSADPTYNAKPALMRMLGQLGAKVVKKLSKDVTHVVYERRQAQRASKDSEQDLRELYARVGKLTGVSIVSPSWVEESRKAKRRLVEHKFVIARPKDEALLLGKPTGRTPGSAAGQGRKRKQAPAPAPPKPLEAFDLDAVISSSQQIRGEGQVEAGLEVSSPRHTAPAAKRAKLGAGTRAAAAPAGKAAAGTSALHSTESQQVADTLAGLLGGPVNTPGGAVEDDWEDADGVDLNTPLSLRLAKSAKRSTSKEVERRQSGPAGRSRLAQASGPQAAGDEGGALPEGEEPSPQQNATTAAAAGDGAPREGSKGAAAAGARGKRLQAAQRYSVRQLSKLEDKPLPLHKGTPLAGVLPPPTDAKKRGKLIPVPAVERVPSPWTEAEQLPSQSQSEPLQQPQQQKQQIDTEGEVVQARPQAAQQAQLRRSFKPPGPVADAPWSAARPWDRRGQQQQQAQQPKEAEGQQQQQGAVHSEGEAAADGAEHEADGSPAGAARGRQHGRGRAAAAAAPRGPPNEEQENLEQPGAGRPAKKQKQAAATAAAATEAPAGDAGGEAQGEDRHRRRGRQRAGRAASSEPAAASAGAVVAAEQEGEGEKDGYLAITSVDPGVVELCKSATRRLRGLRLCSEGREDGRVTHLVIGKERRTLKLMLAVANGAWLVSPEWVTASLEAGKWLPECRFPATVRFLRGAERARLQREVPDAQPLLCGHNIYVHDAARKPQDSNAGALKRVAAALGAQLVPPKDCSVCVVAGGSSRPSHIPKQVPAVREEWLLVAAERFEVPSMSKKEFALR